MRRWPCLQRSLNAPPLEFSDWGNGGRANLAHASGLPDPFRRKSHSSRTEYTPKSLGVNAMTYVFEVVDEAGAIRNYVAKFMRREADKLVVEYRGLQMRFSISHIRDWCAVE